MNPATCLQKTGSETGFLAENLDRLLDRDFQVAEARPEWLAMFCFDQNDFVFFRNQMWKIALEENSVKRRNPRLVD